MITGNKGEWSEVYTLFKLLGDKTLYTGDADLNKVENLFYPIIKVLRNESGENYIYDIFGDIIIISGGNEEIKIPINTFIQQAKFLFSKIKSSHGSFNIPETEEFMKSVNCYSLKAKSTTKTDINIVIHDHFVNQTAELGFSIKSKLGGDSTLLNAGKTTNFIFMIEGFNGNKADINRINTIKSKSKIKDRIIEIKKLGGNFQFVSLEHDIFKNNLVLIDSMLPNILSEIVMSFYSSNLNTIVSLTREISQKNPLNYDTQFSHSFYEYKIKHLLTDISIGMMPSKVWNGKYDATGGYLIVKEDGDILCYHIYNRNQFEDYLFKNTKLETASSTRHDFGQIYSQNGDLFFKLNLQIRFV
jgi:hypothetical protein